MADIRNSAPLQTITPSDAALAIVVSLVSAGWLATVHSATTGGAWSGWLGDLLVTGAVMAAMATAALIMVRGRAAAMPAAAGIATRAVAAAVAIGIVAAGTTAIRASALAGAGGNSHAHGGVGAHVLNHVLLTLAVVVPVALVAAALSEQVDPRAPAQHAPSATTSLAAVSRPAPGRARLVAGVALSTAALVASIVGAPAPVAQAATTPAQACLTTGTPTKTFDIVAMDVDITLNAFGDHDPAGRMYALAAAVPAIRAAEASRKVTPGLRDDPIQPLAIRANEGDCVQINFTNNAAGADNRHPHRRPRLRHGLLGRRGRQQPRRRYRTRAAPRPTRYCVPNDPTLEGAPLHAPGPRQPPGRGPRPVRRAGRRAARLDLPQPDHRRTPQLSGWEADIKPGGATQVRSVAANLLVPRERDAAPRDRQRERARSSTPDGSDMPPIDAPPGSYRPGGFALNYRSEPFIDRLIDFAEEKSHVVQLVHVRRHDEHHPARLPRRPDEDPPHARRQRDVPRLPPPRRRRPLALQPARRPDVQLRQDRPATSTRSRSSRSPQRLDSQSIGPGESFNLEIESGAGGVQQGAGEFLFHCHIAHHYFVGHVGLLARLRHAAARPDAAA